MKTGMGLIMAAMIPMSAAWTAEAAGDGLEAAKEKCREANLIIVVQDAAQAGHCSAYGYPRKTTPNMERLAKEGVLFRTAYASFPSTPPGVRGMLWGLRNRRNPRPGERSFVQSLKEAGFKTCGVTSNFVARAGMNVGFDEVKFVSGPPAKKGEQLTQEQREALWESVSAPKVLAAGLDFLEKNKNSRFFLYLHFLEPHNAYWPPEPWRHMFWQDKPVSVTDPRLADIMAIGAHAAKKGPDAAMEEVIALYDGNLAYGDHHVGLLRDKLEGMGLLENTVLVLTADHGEGWGEHGAYAHNSSVHDEETHIPLVIRLPQGTKVKRQVVEGLVEQVDEVPSLAELLGVDLDGLKPDGMSFWPLVFGGKKEIKEYAFIDSGRFIIGGGEANKPFYAVRTPRYKYILDSATGEQQLYDVRRDPGAKTNTVTGEPKVAKELRAVLDKHFGLEAPAKKD